MRNAPNFEGGVIRVTDTTLFLNFLPTSRLCEARYFKLGTQIAHDRLSRPNILRKMNYTQGGRLGQGHMTIFLNFGTLSLTLEQVKLSTSNVVHYIDI